MTTARKVQSLLVCTINITIGNGCGMFPFVKGQHYPLSRLKADCRLSALQIRAYFKAPDHLSRLEAAK